MPKAARKTKKRGSADYQTQYLEVRRDRYASDTEYREAILQRERDAYRAKRKAEGNPVSEKDFGLNAGSADAWSTTYRRDSTGRACNGMNVNEMAEFLNMSETGLRAWIRTERFPSPGLRTRESITIYTVKEANALAHILFSKLEGRSTLRTTNTDIINALWRAMDN